ncbi:MAG: tetratricopeptide repeat protein, partial [Cyclobacteriaceae bacterium]|nr:tetratricopeptide repeat protein [Cyclobacteriaceae bacterium]
GGKLLSAGSYAVLTKPGQSSWDVMFYPYETGNWAAYPDKTPLVTVKSAPTALPFNVETFTMGFGDLTNDGATLYLYWEKTFVSVPLSVDTKKTVMAQINKFAENPEATLGNAYNASAAYLLTEKENLELALKFATKAVEINPDAYWMSRTKALIEAELGKYKEAIASAQKSMAAAEKAGNQQYVDFNKASIAEWKKK